MEIFLLWLILSIVVGVWASSRGHSGFAMFLVALITSPLIGFLIEAVRSPDAKTVEAASLKSGDMRKCPACAELVKAEAQKCRYCGEALPPQPSGMSAEERAGM